MSETDDREEPDEPNDESESWRDPDDREDGDSADEKMARPSRFDPERWLRRLDFVLQRHEFPTERSFRRFLESEVHQRNAEALDEVMTIEEEAQELAYLALEAEDDTTAETYARDAIALDPDCVDARVLLSFFTTDDLDERIWLLERAVDCGRWRFESAKTGDFRDYYLQRIEAKPLQRSLHSLAETLMEAGEEDEAEKLFEESSQLPLEEEDDVLYLCAAFMLRIGKLEKARHTIERLPVDDAARDWCEVLERFLAGERDEAESLLAQARTRNFYVEQFLTGDTELPAPTKVTPEMSEEQDDAIWIASMLRPAWEAHPEALEWLRAR